jgi:hypothetical protein
MMQMLAAGGLDVMTDGERQADTDNPKGYLEWEAIKQIRKKPELMYQAEGKVVKVISMLLPQLPAKHKYKVIFMERPIDEVVASQTKMIANRGEDAPKVNPQRMKRNLARHRKQIIKGMEKAKHFDALVVDYPALVKEPASWLDKIQAFLGPQLTLDRQSMLAAVDPSLHRNRG